MNVEYQELINVALWQKGSKWHSLPKFVCVCLCNFLIINSRLYALSLNSYNQGTHIQPLLANLRFRNRKLYQQMFFYSQ